LRASLSFCALLLVASCAVHADEELDSRFSRDTLVVVSNAHACYVFDIYLAIDYEQKRRGLMFVRDLPETTGMLFVYDDIDYHSMWMKNTFIPLDIVFARADGTITNVARNTEPQSLKSIASSEPVRFVLELNAGVTEKLGIDGNSRLIWDEDQRDDE
jgi:uncharacterized membrane protein (UPF0127 family)